MWRHSPALLPTGRAGERLQGPVRSLLDVDDRAHVRSWPTPGYPVCVAGLDVS
jgi:hypothetical protein